MDNDSKEKNKWKKEKLGFEIGIRFDDYGIYNVKNLNI